MEPSQVDRRRNDTRARIVEAAVRLFGEKGYGGTTIAEIERTVGLRPGGGGLYRHFTSKEEVLVEAVEQYHERVRVLRRRLQSEAEVTRALPVALDAELHLEHDLRTLLSILGSFLFAEAPIVRLNAEIGALPDRVRRQIGAAWDDGYGLLADLLVRHGVADEASNLLAVHALGAIDHYVSHTSAWGKAPGDISPEVFISAWVSTWSTVALRGVPARNGLS